MVDRIRLVEKPTEIEASLLRGQDAPGCLDGNPRCLEYFMDRLMPVRRGRVLEQQLPCARVISAIGLIERVEKVEAQLKQMKSFER